MKFWQKLGGIAALYEAAAYVVAMVLFLLVINYPSAVEPAQKLALVVANQFTLYWLHFAVYVVFGILLIILSMALYHRLKIGAPNLMQMATVLGFTWAGLLIASGMVYNVGLNSIVALNGKDPTQATLMLLTIDAVSGGLSGNGEVVGGLWSILVSLAALRSGALPRVINYLGLVIGIAGILSVIPALDELQGIFGLLQIVWFIGIGIILVRDNRVPAV